MALDFSIQSISPQTAVAPAAQFTSRAPSADSVAFRNVFEDAMNHVEGTRQDAHEQIQQFLAGETEDPHKMILSIQNADLTFQLFMQVRNKFTSAYQEVMRMQL